MGECFGFFCFLKSTSLKSEFLVSMNRTVMKSSLHKRLPLNFLAPKFYRHRNSQVFDFLTVILNYLNIREIYPAIPIILGSILWVGFGKLICYATTHNFLTPRKFFAPRKSKNFDFVTVFFFWNLVTFLENYPPNVKFWAELKLKIAWVPSE